MHNHTRTRTRTCTRAHTHKHARVHAHTHISAHTHAHTHTHAYSSARAQASPFAASVDGKALAKGVKMDAGLSAASGSGTPQFQGLDEILLSGPRRVYIICAQVSRACVRVCVWMCVCVCACGCECRCGRGCFVQQRACMPLCMCLQCMLMVCFRGQWSCTPPALASSQKAAHGRPPLPSSYDAHHPEALCVLLELQATAQPTSSHLLSPPHSAKQEPVQPPLPPARGCGKPLQRSLPRQTLSPYLHPYLAAN